MRNLFRVIAGMCVATMMLALPVCAAEPQPTTEQLLAIEAMNTARVNAEVADLIKKANGNPEGPQWSGHLKTVQEDLNRLYADNAVKYVSNLKSVLAGKQEIVRARTEAVNNFTTLSQSNPAFAADLTKAQSELAVAVADMQRVANELVIAQATFGIK